MSFPASLIASLIAPTLALATGPAASPTPAGHPSVPILFTAMHDGIFGGSTTWNEPWSLFQDEPIDGVKGTRLEFEAAVLRCGRCFLWDPAGPPSTAKARAFFGGTGLKLTGAAWG